MAVYWHTQVIGQRATDDLQYQNYKLFTVKLDKKV